MAEQMLGSIIHLTDMHLLVDDDGNYYNVQQARSIEILRLLLRAAPGGLEEGLNYAHGDVVAALINELPTLVERELLKARGAPLVLVHTGDAEAFGTEIGGKFRGYELLETRLWPQVRNSGVGEVVQVYGNHDVWSGTVSIFAPQHHAAHLNELSKAVPDFAGPWPSVTVVPSEVGPPLVFLRVNTVRTSAGQGGVLARGKVSSHPPGADWKQAMADIEVPAGIRIVVSHHPFHAFAGCGDEASGLERFVRAMLRKAAQLTRLDRIESRMRAVTGAQEFAKHADRLKIALCISGHRHELDPPARDSRSVLDRSQLPLGQHTGQLVAESPTQRIGSVEEQNDPQSNSDGAIENSISVYRIARDEASDSIVVTRCRYVYASGDGFNPSQPAFIDRRILSDIPLTD